jgi:adenosine deaminase
LKAKKAGMHITVHSGESPQPQSAQWVKDSIDILGAERIGHGVQIIRNPEIMTYLRDKKIPLEICPISNWLTQAFPNYEDHPIRQLINAGLLVTINSDDPGVFATTLSDDYERNRDVEHGKNRKISIHTIYAIC